MIIGIDASNIQIGGGVTHLVELLNKSNPQKHKFKYIVVWSNNSVLNLINNNSWIIKKSTKILNLNLFFRLYWQIFKLKKAAIIINCDILFTPGGNNLSGFQPSVSMCRNMLPFEWRELRRFGFSLTTVKLLLLKITQLSSFKKSTGVIFLTQYAEKRIKPYIKYYDTITEIIPHGISNRFYLDPKIQKEKSEFNFKNPCKILYVSIIDLYKHQWKVVKAVSLLRQKGIPVEITIVGSFSTGKYKLLNELEKINNHKDYIKITGGLPYLELHKLYVKSDICLFASSCENMPNILLEGMASGLPIACSNRGPMPEILKDGGIYFNPESSIEIADAIFILFESKQLRDNLANVSRRYATKYSWDKCADRTFKFLNEINKVT